MIASVLHMAITLLLFGEVATRAHHRAMASHDATDYSWAITLCGVVDTFREIRDIMAKEISRTT